MFQTASAADAAAKTRAAIVDYCEWGIANAANIHYSQGPERLSHLGKPRTLPAATDCSGFATLAYKDAGAPNPNRMDGLWLPGPAFTGTMLRAGKKVTTPQPGDLLIYGDWPGHHVVIFMEEWHGAWIVCSHGQEIGPLAMRQHREQLYQGCKPEIRSYLPRA